MQKHSIGKFIGATLLALLAGVFAPISLSFATPVFGVIGTVLYAWAGFFPAFVYALVGVMMSFLLGGGVFAAGFALAILVPAGLALACIRRKVDFKKCMRVSVYAQTATIVLALGIAWLAIGRNLIDWWFEQVVAVLKLMPETFFETFDTTLILLLEVGVFGPAASGVDVSTGVLSAADRLILIDEYGRLAVDAYKIQLAGMILTGSMLTGVLNVALPVWIYARRGDERGIRRLPTSEWRVGYNAAIGLPICVAISYVLFRTGYPGGEAVWYAMWELFKLILRFQMLGAVSRAGKKNGASLVSRGVVMFIFMTTLTGPGSFLGGASLYLGSKGIVTEWMKKRQKMNGEDK